jgi:hypothetical protein
MTKTLKRLDLLLKEVKDPHTQENFWRLKNLLSDLSISGVPGPQGPQGPVGPSGSTLAAEYAAALKVTRVANEAILKGDALYAVSSTHVALAGASTLIGKATVFGFADANAASGDNIVVTLAGILEDPLFSVFTVNSPLFLDVSGGITDVKRSSGFHVIIGKSLGSNQIFISIREPLHLA